MRKKNHVPTFLGIPTHNLSEKILLYLLLVVLGILSIQVMCTPVKIKEIVTASETIDGGLGLDVGRLTGETSVGLPENLLTENKLGSELKKTSEGRPIEQADRKAPQSRTVTNSRPTKSYDSAFEARNSPELLAKLRTKKLEDLPNLKDELRVNPLLNNQAIAIKDNYIDIFHQANRLTSKQERELEAMRKDYFTYKQKRSTMYSNIKALLISDMLRQDPKKVSGFVQRLRNIPKHMRNAGRGGREWLSVLSDAEEEYKKLYLTRRNLFARIFRRFSQPSQWRKERMLKDFQKARVLNFQGQAGARHRFIFEVQDARIFGFKPTRLDQDLIHKITSGGPNSHLSRSDQARIETSRQNVAGFMEKMLEAEKTWDEYKTHRLAASAHTILKTKPASELSSGEKDLLAKLDTYSPRQYDIGRDASTPDRLRFSSSERDLLQKYVKEYDDVLPAIGRYSSPPTLQINEIKLDSKFSESQLRAQEVLEAYVEKGTATETQKRLLSLIKTEAKRPSPSIRSKEVPALAEAFWERQVKLSPRQKAQLFADLITPELSTEFSIKPNVLEELKNLGPESEVTDEQRLLVEKFSQLNDKFLVSMSKQERAFQELLARQSEQVGKSGRAGINDELAAQMESLKSSYNGRTADRIREIIYAQAHWHPTIEQMAVKRADTLKNAGISLSKQQRHIIAKIEKKQLLSDDEHAESKKLAIDSVLAQEPEVPAELKERALKLAEHTGLGDLSEYDLALLQNLKDADMNELVRIASLPADDQEFRQYSKFIQISQILKRAEQRRVLDISPKEANLLYLVGRAEMDITKTQLKHFQSKRDEIGNALEGFNVLRRNLLGHLPH